MGRLPSHCQRHREWDRQNRQRDSPAGYIQAGDAAEISCVEDARLDVLQSIEFSSVSVYRAGPEDHRYFAYMRFMNSRPAFASDSRSFVFASTLILPLYPIRFRFPKKAA